MEILAYEPGMCESLARSYNDAVAGLPYCFPVQAEAVRASLAGEGECHPRLSSDSIYVAMDGQTALGLIHLAVESPEDDPGVDRGIIRFFWYQRGSRAAGQELLDACHRRLGTLGAPRVLAFHQDYRHQFYHLGHAYLSDRLDHVHGLMGYNGYQRLMGEVYLEWPDFQAAEPAPVDVEFDLHIERRDGGGTRPGVQVKAMRDDEMVGTCVNLSAEEFAGAPELRDSFLTKWLWVHDDLRGRRVGMHLLQRALLELKQVGYRNAIISTSWTNFRAQLFYGNCGYRATDWTYAVGRSLLP